MNDNFEIAAPSKDEFRRWKALLPVIRRAIRAGCKKGRPWDRAATVDEIASRFGEPAEEVVRLIRCCGYFVGLNSDDGPMGAWTVFEDGE